MIRARHLLIPVVGLVLVLVASRFFKRAEPPADTGPLPTASSPVPPAATATPAPEAAEPPPAPPAVALKPDLAARARTLAARLATLLAGDRALTAAEEAELQSIEAELLALGEASVAPLVERLDHSEATAGGRDRMFNILRRLPGAAVEERLVAEARGGARDSMRTMAMESLALRKSERALDALSTIARTNPKLPARPLITAPRDPDNPSTELPDEEVFTPRMQAMTALASTKDPRAVPVLTDLVRNGADESLRMEAARNLEGLRSDPRAAETLSAAASNDPSPYVRLAALHALNGSTDPTLAPVLQGIVAHDRDAGVRALAQQVLAGLSLR